MTLGCLEKLERYFSNIRYILLIERESERERERGRERERERERGREGGRKKVRERGGRE